MYPKLVALDTDWTLFWGWLDQNTWGKGPGAFSPVEDNIEKSGYWEVIDRSNPNNKCGMYADVPRIIQDILKNGAQIAIVSRNTSKPMCDRALWYMHVNDENGNDKPLIDLVKYDEVYNQEKTVHFSKIKEWSGFDYSDMILYDDEAINNPVEMMLGVTFQVSRDQKGLTWDNYQQGLATWRRNKEIRSPYLGTNPSSYPKRKFLGYSGMDLGTIQLLESGGRRQDRKEAARWGYAMYVADDPRIARYFNEWIKGNAFGQQATTIVCKIWARDGDIFDRLQKLWIPDWTALQTDVQNWDAFRIAWSQEDRDKTAAFWGVQKPYILFARHPNMGAGFPIRNGSRWNEMVIYGQVQEGLIFIERMSDQQLKDDIKAWNYIQYNHNISAWNITAPQETWNEFRLHGEQAS
ncbi:hypothetical protein K435DRAFT_971238 [Dendrothele bispora CBS 962.96]|uniref:Magnesium-dependent phosphatase-1 n=1 Tax=Dendrothele bispora (strain CBS 962.96) TaxID=1314807 RepID=A0A4S8L6R7_DENBC|nr:hypothetical protein K435DRAFT_844927 [Dendrothele bispora CBS 962.96]THU84299.1 hypothetical protein K435DRAFT_971238 [Dendrothele bispora CBS 962.96]